MEDVKRNVRMSNEDYDMLKEIAAKEDRSISAVIRVAIKEYIKKNKNKLK